MPYILALDQGTTSSRAIVFDRDGAHPGRRAEGIHARSFPQRRLGRARPAGDLGVADRRRRRGARPRAASRPSDIAAIGITNQRETTIVWDRETGEPVHNAIVWQDRRTADFCERLKAEGAGDTIQAKTGLLIDAYFSASKIRWILDHVPGARARADAGKLAFGTVDTWLIWKLTGRRAARHRRQQRLADDAVQHPHAAVGRRAAAPVRHPGEHAARGAVVERGLRRRLDVARHRRVPIAGIAGDQQAALFGQMCRAAGHVEEHLRHRLLPAAEHRHDADARRGTSWSRPSRGRSAAAPSTRSRAASSSAARSCSGFATASA